MESAVLPLLTLQFFVAALLWLGALPLPEARLSRGPALVQGDLTRLVLPVVLIVCGLLFFSSPLAAVWRPLIHGGGGWGGFEPALGIRVFTALNVTVTAVAVAATGGTRRSPFTPLLVLLPGLLWGVGLPRSELLAGVVLTVVATGVASVPGGLPADPSPWEPSKESATPPFRLRLSRGIVLAGALGLVALSFWFGAAEGTAHVTGL
ncbi:MAG: hypothetical protein EA422_05740 [Gemmatimonadales bacterium]|nr:MAG: hypothetical protein EA422_05740 [Gemmatimonadales bacterium]